MLGEKTFLAGGPGGEELETVRGRGVRGCRVDVELQPRLGGQLHRLEVEVELTHDGVAQPLATGTVKSDVLGGPPLAE